MTKSTITREESVQAVFDLKVGYRLGFADIEFLKRVARMALAAMDSEPDYKERKLFCSTDTARMRKVISASAGSEATPIYRHAQQPVVPQDVLDALQKVARIRLDLNGFDGDRRGIADCLCDAEEALIEVVNRRAAMLAAAPQLPGIEPATVPGKWIPVSERMPEDEQEVLTINRMGHCFVSFFDKHSGLFFDRIDAPAACCIEHVLVTHWMPLPAAPQEVKDAHH